MARVFLPHGRSASAGQLRPQHARADGGPPGARHRCLFLRDEDGPVQIEHRGMAIAPRRWPVTRATPVAGPNSCTTSAGLKVAVAAEEIDGPAGHRDCRIADRDRNCPATLTASRFTSHSDGPGRVSPKSLTSKTRRRSGDANAPKLA